MTMRAIALPAWILGIASLVLAGVASAQAPAPAPGDRNAQAMALAQRLGGEWSVEGFETVVRSGNPDLVIAYERGFRTTSFKRREEAGRRKVPLPEPIEKIIVEHYRDPGMGRAMMQLFNASGASYRSRALFDLMYADWRSGRIPHGSLLMRDAILSTDLPGIEPQVLEALAGLDAGDGGDGGGIASFLAERRYAPAIPVLVERLRQAKPGRGTNITVVLLEFATPAAVGAVLERLAWLRTQPASPDVVSESTSIAQQVANLPPTVPVDYAAFRKGLAETERGALLTFATKRNEKNAVPDMLAMLGDPKLAQGALRVLIATDSPEVWRQARATVEQLKREGRMDEGHYRYATSMLDAKIADPAKHFAEQKQAERGKAYEARKAPLSLAVQRARGFARTDAERYVREMPGALDALAKLADEYADLPQANVGLRGEIANEYLALGHAARLRLHRPQQAIVFYQVARRNRLGTGAFAVADTQQFDLHDRAAALATYRTLLEENRSAALPANDMEAGLAQWARRWLQAQVAFLERGERFAGPVSMEDLGAVSLAIAYGGAAGIEDFGLAPLQSLIGGEATRIAVSRREVGQRLAALPASGFALLASAPFLGFMPDADAVLAHLEKNDPAGFASACYFALVQKMQEGVPTGIGRGAFMLPQADPSPLAAAAQRFFAARRVVLRTAADPRMATPEKTWELLLDALGRNDLDTAAACLMPGQQAKFMPMWRAMTPQQLREMAGSFTPLKVTGSPMGRGMVEGFAARGSHGGLIYFVNVGGAWKIQEM